MDENVMVLYLDKVVFPYVKCKLDELGLTNLMPLFLSDAFKAHHTAKIREKFADQGILSHKIPPGCTSKAQPLDVVVNRPFKQILRSLWCNYMTEKVHDLQDSGDPNGRIKTPTNEIMTQWVSTACAELGKNTDMLKMSFDVTGITLKAEKVSDSHLKNALKLCGDRLKEKFGENFNSENFEFGVTDDFYSYDTSENPFQ